jgi:RNA polymerase sigma-70 factor (ECF subfamily)
MMPAYAVKAEMILEENRENPGYEWELVRRAQRGDKAAFEEIYRKNIGRVYAVCVRICADGGRAEELTQDVFVLAWQKLRTFRGESAFFSWLHRLTVNAVLMEQRSRKRRADKEVVTDELENLEQPNSALEPGRKLLLEKVISQLPPQARTIFVLHDVEGYRHNEIAGMLKLAVGTCKAQLFRARKLLKEVLR